jgi:hypothetical protein
MTKINAKEAIERIRKMLFADGGQAAGSADGGGGASATSYVLKDGTTVSITDGLAVGSQVLVNAADGNQPAPDGELELSDGTTISITGGLITEIETASQEVDEQNGGETPDQAQFKRSEMLSDKITALEKELTTFKEKFSKQTLAQEELISLVAQLADLPAGEPIIKPTNIFSETRSKQDSHIRQLADSLQKLRDAKN